MHTKRNLGTMHFKLKNSYWKAPIYSLFYYVYVFFLQHPQMRICTGTPLVITRSTLQLIFLTMEVVTSSLTQRRKSCTHMHTRNSCTCVCMFPVAVFAVCIYMYIHYRTLENTTTKWVLPHTFGKILYYWATEAAWLAEFKSPWYKSSKEKSNLA